jgi:hypothetical protein
MPSPKQTTLVNRRKVTIEQAALGPDGFLNHLRSNALWVDCSSVNPSFSKKMAVEAARRQVYFVDAPGKRDPDLFDSAITRELLISIRKEYWHVQSVP